MREEKQSKTRMDKTTLEDAKFIQQPKTAQTAQKKIILDHSDYHISTSLK